MRLRDRLADLMLTRSGARVLAGGGAFALTGAVLAIIVFKPELAQDDLFKTIAQAIVIQGLIGLVMAFLFTAGARRGDDGGQG